MLHSLRYISILKVLKSSGFSFKHRIAEIGAGISGMSGYIDKSFIGCDINFPGKPPERMMPVRCSVFGLPFPDRSIDFVVSSDMMEHIPAPMRSLALSEMLRVTSRCLIVAFPEGEAARECDIRIYKALKKAGKKIPSWLSEHLEEKHSFPEAGELKEMIEKLGFDYKEYPNENMLLHRIGVSMESIPAYRKMEWWTRNIPTHHLWKVVLPFLNMGKTYRRLFAVYPKP